MNLNQVTLPAVSVEESVVFYRAMGFVQIVADEHYARFECPEGESTFSVELCEECVQGDKCVIYFEVKDLLCSYVELKNKGFKFLSEPKDKEWLWREARLLDPAGNEICLYVAGTNRKYPPWRIN